MKRMFVMMLVAALAVSLAGAVMAQATSPTPGTGNVNFTIQNLDSATTAEVTAQYVGQTGSVDKSRTMTITALGSQGFEAAASGLDDNWMGSVVASANTEIVAFGQAIWSGGSSTDGKTNGAYEAFTQGATKLYLPSLAARQNQFSRISVQSAAAPSTSDTINFTIKLYDREGNLDGTITGQVNHGAQKTYDLSYEKQGTGGVPDLDADWLGAAVVESTSPIAAVCTMHWADYAGAYSGVPAGGKKAYLASATRRIPDGATWLQYTGVVVQNLDATVTANVTVKWFDRNGTQLFSFPDTIPANSAHGYNTRLTGSNVPDDTALQTALTNDWNGSVVIESNTDIVAVANLQWTPQHPAKAAAAAYTSVAGGYSKLYIPASFRRIAGGAWTQYTGAIVQNVGAGTCTDFQVQWFARGNPTALLDYKDTLASNISHGYNTGAAASDFPSTVDRTQLGDDFRGSIVITANGCQLSAIHNTVWPAWTDNTTYNAFGK